MGNIDDPTNNINKQILNRPIRHNQYIEDPLKHFLSIPWAARLLQDPDLVEIIVPDRSHLPSGDLQFTRKVMNGPGCVRACVAFRRPVPPEQLVVKVLSVNESLLNSNELNQVKGLGILNAERERYIGSPRPCPSDFGLLEEAGPDYGESKEKPFLLLNALLDVGKDMTSYENCLHGGAIMAFLDESMVSAAHNLSKHAVTAEMTTTLLKPVRLPCIVLVRARVISRMGRKMVARAALENEKGEILARSQGVLIDMTSKL